MKSIGNSRGTLPSIRSIHENSYAWHHTSLDDLNKLLNVTPCTLGGVYRWMPLMYAARNGANEDASNAASSNGTPLNTPRTTH